MNRSLARNAISGLLFFLFAACSTPSRTRFEVAPATASASRVSNEDREAVREVVAKVAKQLRLQEFTSSSLVPETIAYYQQADTRDPLKIIAWMDNDRIFVDLMQVPPQPGDSAFYERARSLLQRELRARFGERNSIVSFRDLNRPAQSEAR